MSDVKQITTPLNDDLAKSLKAGDRVLFTKYSGTEVKMDGEEYTILREDDVLGLVTNN